eukprot:9488041-Pyramimonas_sp.AAC.1
MASAPEYVPWKIQNCQGATVILIRGLEVPGNGVLALFGMVKTQQSRSSFSQQGTSLSGNEP